jgi:hypothetical protein
MEKALKEISEIYKRNGINVIGGFENKRLLSRKFIIQLQII